MNENCICMMKEEQGAYDLLDGSGKQVNVLDAGYVSMEMRKLTDGRYQLVVTGEDTGKIGIKYCPFCGRKLC